jgi:hypothetical protein
MINSQYFEIPGFCATDTRKEDCDECLDILKNPKCAAAFGLDFSPTHPVPPCTCHDICVEEVRLIGTISGERGFNHCFNFPPIGPCRLGAGVTLPEIDTRKRLKVFVVSAQESLDGNCQAINVKIRILILATTTTCNNILLPLDIDVCFDTFFRFPECEGPVTCDELQNALAEIDGSCLVIQLKAHAACVCGTTKISLSGKIIDKLWKNENLWITGIRPYELSEEQKREGFVSFTVHDVFNNAHKMGDCGPISCHIPMP